ncbi:MAG: hypothetical protein KDB05_06795 [Planctomycetales bacterium]|nr:hypothetical protein [Planctomycetales bacterium]
MERIKFRCPNCSKALAIDAKHAGKQVACPGCSTHLTIPTESALATNPLEPAPQTATAQPTASQPAAQPNPFAIDTPQTNPVAPATSPYADSPYASSMPAVNTAASPGPTPASPSASANTSIGKSIAGLVVAMLVAGVFTAIWLVVVAMSGYELGILAWGMGGAVGLVAGLIGRNPSSVYCGLAAAIAVMSVLAAKGIMIAVLMAMSWGAEFVMDLADLSPEQEKFRAVMADQMLVNGELSGMEKQYAEAYVTAYFSGGDVYDEMTDEMYEVSDQVDEKIQAQLDLMSEPDQELMCAAARERHPEWIEDHNHFLAIVDEMQHEENALTAELAAHAKYETAMLDNAWDDEYYESVEGDEITKRQRELRVLAAKRVNAMDESQRDQLVLTSLQRHLSWNPFPDAHNAMLEKMHGEGVFTGPMAEHAKATIEYEMTDGYPDYFDEISEEDMESRDEQLVKMVNERLISLDAAARQALIADAESRYPDWYHGNMTGDADLQELQEAMDEIGTDGSFRGNFLAVFSFMDLLWLFLGASTAFGTARRYGMNE